MDPKKKLILDQSKHDAAKAGRMFLDAVFGDTDTFLRKLGKEGDDVVPSEEDDEFALPAPEKGRGER